MLITCPHCGRDSEHFSIIRLNGLSLELETYWARRDGTSVKLSQIEASVVSSLMVAGDDGMTQRELAQLVYRGEARSTTALPMAVSRARAKLSRLRADIPTAQDPRNHRYRILVRA